MSMTIANAVLVHYWSHKPHWTKHYIKVIIDCNGCNPFSQCFCNKGERERERERRRDFSSHQKIFNCIARIHWNLIREMLPLTAFSN